MIRTTSPSALLFEPFCQSVCVCACVRVRRNRKLIYFVFMHGGMICVHVTNPWFFHLHNVSIRQGRADDDESNPSFNPALTADKSPSHRQHYPGPHASSHGAETAINGRSAPPFGLRGVMDTTKAPTSHAGLSRSVPAPRTILAEICMRDKSLTSR